MGYLVCKRCGGYYKLREGESANDFVSCQCYGLLVYVESLDDYSEAPKRLESDSNIHSATFIDVGSDDELVRPEDLNENHEESVDESDSEDLEKEHAVKNRAYYRRINYYSKPDIDRLKLQHDVTNLINALYFDDPEIKLEAAKALSVIGDERALKPLENVMDEESGTLKIYAEIAINQIKSKKKGFKSQNRGHYRSNYRKIPTKTIPSPTVDEIKKHSANIPKSGDSLSNTISDSSSTPYLKKSAKSDEKSLLLSPNSSNVMGTSSASILKVPEDKTSENTVLADESVDGLADEELSVDKTLGDTISVDESVVEPAHGKHSLDESVSESLNAKLSDDNSSKGTTLQDSPLGNINDVNSKENIYNEPKNVINSSVSSLESKHPLESREVNVSQTTLDHQAPQISQIKTTKTEKDFSRLSKTPTEKKNTITKTKKATSSGNLTKGNLTETGEVTEIPENIYFIRWLNIKNTDKELIGFICLFAFVMIVGVLLTMNSI